jgi:hypothetical protein
MLTLVFGNGRWIDETLVRIVFDKTVSNTYRGEKGDFFMQLREDRRFCYNNAGFRRPRQVCPM